MKTVLEKVISTWIGEQVLATNSERRLSHMGAGKVYLNSVMAKQELDMVP